MKAQTGLTFFVGDILVGVVALIVALIIAWASLTPLLDACKIGGGIAYDIVSVVQSEFAVPGEVSFFYEPPSGCEAKGNIIMCNPSQGWNPNITSLKYAFNYIDGYFGFDNEVPLSAIVNGKVFWEEKGVQRSSKIQVSGLGTLMYSSPYFDVEANNGKIEITKKEYTYGSGFYFSGSDPLVSLSNKILYLSKSCEKSNKKLFTVVKLQMPSNWEIAWNKTYICEYSLVLNSWVYSYNRYNELSKSTSISQDQVKLLNETAGFWYSYIDKVKNTYLNEYKNRTVFLTYDGSLGYVFLYNNKYYSEAPPNNDIEPYDPYNQTNVAHYSTGWEKIICLDFSEIGKNAKIKNYEYSFNYKASNEIIKCSDGMVHPLFVYKKFNLIKTWTFNVTYDCNTNSTEVTLVSIE